MRLSESIMLGAATCILEAANINSCAYGCALNAEGVPQIATPTWRYGLERESFMVGLTARYRAIHELWPWTAPEDIDEGWVSELAGDVWRMFDNSVCEGRSTLEQLADYVRSIEPDCDCNRFNCDCKAEQEAIAEVEHAHQT